MNSASAAVLLSLINIPLRDSVSDTVGNMAAGGLAKRFRRGEQRYSEEQDAIDRETKKKLREMEQEEKMKNLPSDAQETGQKVHQIRLAKSYFDDVANGIKTFELRKNDRGYKKGDILEMMEFADGKNTGRTVKVLVTYILEDYTGIEDGYCVMATKLMKDGEE